MIASHHGSYVAGLYYTPDPPAPREIAGKWEVVLCGDMVRIRWSLPLEDGAMFWCRHYPATRWGINAVEGEAKEWNEAGRLPTDITISGHASMVPETLPESEFQRRIAIFNAHNAKRAGGCL